MLNVSNVIVVNSLEKLTSVFLDVLANIQKLDYLVCDFCDRNINNNCLERFIYEQIITNNAPAILTIYANRINEIRDDRLYFHKNDIFRDNNVKYNEEEDSLYIRVNKTISFNHELWISFLIDNGIPVHIILRETYFVEKYLKNYWKNTRAYFSSNAVTLFDSRDTLLSWIPHTTIRLVYNTIDTRKIQIEEIIMKKSVRELLKELKYYEQKVQKIAIEISSVKIYPSFETRKLRKNFKNLKYTHDTKNNKTKLDTFGYNVIYTIPFEEKVNKIIQVIENLFKQVKQEFGIDYYVSSYARDAGKTYLFNILIRDGHNFLIRVPIFVQFIRTF